MVGYLALSKLSSDLACYRSASKYNSEVVRHKPVGSMNSPVDHVHVKLPGRASQRKIYALHRWSMALACPLAEKHKP
jgi:hypothetical protein